MATISDLEARRGTRYDEDYTFALRHDAFYPEVVRAKINLSGNNPCGGVVNIHANRVDLHKILCIYAMDYKICLHQEEMSVSVYVGFKNKHDENAFKEAVLAKDPMAEFMRYENRLLMDEDIYEESQKNKKVRI